MQLLVYLVLAPQSKLNLRSKLQQSAQQYIGVLRHFTLSIGRLAFADSPDWMSDQDEQVLEDLTGRAVSPCK